MYILYLAALFIYFLTFILERERQCEQGRDRERERERERERGAESEAAPDSELSAQSLMWGLNPQTVRS